MWNKVKSIKGVQKSTCIILLRTNNNKSIITEPLEIANALGEYFQEISDDNNFDPNFSKYKSEIEKQNINVKELTTVEHINTPNLNLTITRKELDNTINEHKSNCCGPDDIPFIFIQNLPEIGKITSLKILNKMWTQHKFPKKWKQATIIPIHKPNQNKFAVQGYRPISLLCTMSKIFKKIVSVRLNWFLEKNKFLAEEQFGFRKNRSTYDCLVNIDTEICETIVCKQYMGLVSFDIQKACDMTRRYRIILILLDWGVKGKILYFIHNFLIDRTFEVAVDGHHSSLYNLNNGIAQGSSISGKLFLIAINDLPKLIPTPGKITIYADDSNIFFRHKCIDTLGKELQKYTNSLNDWSKNTGFKFAPEKSQFIIFSHKKIKNKPTLKMDNKIIPYTKHLKILGLTFDEKLTWTTHIKKLKDKAKKRLNIIKVLSGTKWGADSKTLINIYNSLIRSILDYGSSLYMTSRNSALTMLDVIHNAGLRMASGAFRSSPINSILNITGEQPLNNRRNQLMLQYAVRTATDPNKPTYSTEYSITDSKIPLTITKN